MAGWQPCTSAESEYFATIWAVDSWQSVQTCYHQLSEQLSPEKVLFILDDIDQCEYTSMHASDHDVLTASRLAKKAWMIAINRPLSLMIKTTEPST